MAGQRQDYLLAEMNRFRERIAAALNERQPDAITRALQLALELQVKLFPLPAPEFLALPPAEQFARFGQSLPANVAREAREHYVELLFYTATLYDMQDKVELATGARQLALHLALLAALRDRSAAAMELIEPLQLLLPREQIAPDVEALQREYSARKSGNADA